MNLEKAKTEFTIKDAVTNIMQSVHEVIEISKSIDFKKQCLEVFSVNEFEDLKVDSSRKLTNLLKKRHGLHKKVDKDCLSSNISGSNCSQRSESSFFRSSNSILVEKSEITNHCLVKKCITSHYSPIRKRHRSEPLTSFPKNQIYSDVVSIDTESFQDLENIKFSNASNENVLDTSIISDFIENTEDLFSKEISNVNEKINTKETVNQPDIATFNEKFQTPSVQHVTSNEGSPISTSTYGQDSFSLLNKIITPDSFSSSDDNFEALDNLFFFNQCPKDYSVNQNR